MSNRKQPYNQAVAADEQALRDIELEELRRKMEELYQVAPMEWLKDKFEEDPADFVWSTRPMYKEHKWDGSKDPLFRAWQSLANNHWVGVEAATGTSKTYMLSRLVFWFLDVFPDSLVVTSAPKQSQLTLNLWAEISKAFYKFKKIRPNAALYTLRLVVDDSQTNSAEVFDAENPDLSKSHQAIGFVAGVGAEEASATKAQGFHRQHMLIITEETPGMPNAVMTAFKNTCTGEHNLICAVGNPDSQLDPLHQFCALPNVRAYRISAYDYPNVVENREIIKGAVTNASITRRRAEYGENSPMFNSRVRGISPTQDADSLIKLEWLERCAQVELPYDGSYHAVGVDVANSKDGDKAALAWGRGNILERLEEFYCDNATHLAYNLHMDTEQLINMGYTDYNCTRLLDYNIMPGLVGVDAVGIGVATVNPLKDFGYDPVAIQGGQWEEVIPVEEYVDEEGKEKERRMYKFNGLRSQLYWELREDLRLGKIYLALEDTKLRTDLFVELISIKVVYKDNFIAVESKDNIKKRLGNKSPNKADAVAYWNWVRKGYRLTGSMLPVG